VDQLTGVKGFMGGSSPVPTRSALRRQMLPTPNLTIDGKRQLSSFQNLKTQCAFKLAELVETHRMAIKPGGDQDEITEEFLRLNSATWTRMAS
jgi:hypothetical protein